MKRMTGAVLAAVMLAAAPAWADRDDDRGRGHGHGHGHEHKHWKDARHYHPHYAPPRVVYREVVRHHAYYAPAPVYYAPRPAAGIHVVLPNIYIPIR
ncbi:MAG: hypothetical protein RLZZ445_1200 [Pseudomonadota bacterium]|jgi:ABC-type Zn2+ transport system substrate-binding protein/surface adhesin